MTRHPVEALLRHHAHFGTTPKAKELDELQVTPAVRDRIRKAAGDAAEIHASGHKGPANEHALQASLAIVDDLPPGQQDPDYLKVDPLEDITDPGELAARIPRYGRGI